MQANDEQYLAEVKRRLLARRDELRALTEVGQDAAATVALDQTRVGRLSRMDALQAQAMAQETNRRRNQELAQIDTALRRVDTGDYGFCTQCDEPIAAARLQHNPAAALCIACASAAEHR